MPADVAVDQSRIPPPVNELVARIERIIRCRTGGRIRELRVELQGTDVVISGIAPTYYAKQLATHAALDEVAGHTLTNAIDVL